MLYHFMKKYFKLILFFLLSISFLSCSVSKKLEHARNKGEKLRKLNLGWCKLTEIPQEVFEFSNLEVLRLYKNRLETIPPEIEKLKNLKKLTVSSNRLKSIPPEIGNLWQLEELILKYNKIKEIPPEIGMLEKLILMDLEVLDQIKYNQN